MKYIGVCVVLSLFLLVLFSGCVTKNQSDKELVAEYHLGCDYNKPPCLSNTQDCINNQCVTKSGCQYNNSVCDSYSQNCINNTCVTKTGCAYNNPKCDENYICSDNVCIPENYNYNDTNFNISNQNDLNNSQTISTGCQYNNPSCNLSIEDCINNVCVMKNGCEFNNPVCGTGTYCANDLCVSVKRWDCDSDVCKNIINSLPVYIDEKNIGSRIISEDNIFVISPKGYDTLSEKTLLDLKYCKDLIPSFVGIEPNYDKVILKYYISLKNNNSGGYSDGYDAVPSKTMYSKSQENIDSDQKDIELNSPEGFYYNSSPIYCSNAHEFTHYVVGNTLIPRWANEGIAEYSQKFNQKGSKDDVACLDNGWYGMDYWETDQNKLFSYSNLSLLDSSSNDPGYDAKWYHSAMCFWELFDKQFSSETRKKVFQYMQNKYSFINFARNETDKVYNYNLEDGSVIYISFDNVLNETTKLFIENILTPSVNDKYSLDNLLSKFGFVKGKDYNN